LAGLAEAAGARLLGSMKRHLSGFVASRKTDAALVSSAPSSCSGEWGPDRAHHEQPWTITRTPVVAMTRTALAQSWQVAKSSYWQAGSPDCCSGCPGGSCCGLPNAGSREGLFVAQDARLRHDEPPRFTRGQGAVQDPEVEPFADASEFSEVSIGRVGCVCNDHSWRIHSHRAVRWGGDTLFIFGRARPVIETKWTEAEDEQCVPFSAPSLPLLCPFSATKRLISGFRERITPLTDSQSRANHVAFIQMAKQKNRFSAPR
jgi:hypothetical protein